MEHTYGISIETLDNPGWKVQVDLETTPLDRGLFEALKIEPTDDDWIHAWVEDHKWIGACGPLNLVECLQAFVRWAEAPKAHSAEKRPEP